MSSKKDVAKENHAQRSESWMPARLPWIESTFYVCAWSTVVAYTVYSIYLTSSAPENIWDDENVVAGWSFLGRKKDVSGFEWNFWRDIITAAWPWLIGQVLIGQAMRWISYERRWFVFIPYSFAALYSMVGVAFIALLVAHCMLVYASTRLRSAAVVWLTSLCLLATLNIDQLIPPLTAIAGGDHSQYFLLVFTVAMSNIRYTSFCLEKVRQPPAPPGGHAPKYTFADLIIYMFYFALFFTGPILTYDEFHAQAAAPLRPWTTPAVLLACRSAARLAFWALVVELSLHFLYVHAIQADVRILATLAPIVLASCIFLQGQLFMVQYVVMFGIPSLLASLDQFRLPDGPRCISTIYLYSAMWKYFDRGLYNFLKRYIYIPVGGSSKGPARNFLSSVLCFAFIFYWHGPTLGMLVWTVLNFVGVVLEICGSYLTKTETIYAIERRLSPAMGRRVRAAFSAPLFAMSIIAIIYFFSGSYVGNFAVNKLIIEGTWLSYLASFMILYVAVQSGMQFTLYRAQRRKQLRRD